MTNQNFLHQILQVWSSRVNRNSELIVFHFYSGFLCNRVWEPDRFVNLFAIGWARRVVDGIAMALVPKESPNPSNQLNSLPTKNI